MADPGTRAVEPHAPALPQEPSEGDFSPYRVFRRDEWARLRADTPLTLTAEDVARLQSLNDPISLEEVIAIYLPLSRLLSLYVAATHGLFKATQRFLLAENDGKVMFSFELAYAGVFRIVNVPQENLHPLIMIECPRLLFPFAREIIATAVRDGGFPPLMLDPVDFVGLYRQNMERQAAAAQQQKPS